VTAPTVADQGQGAAPAQTPAGTPTASTTPSTGTAPAQSIDALNDAALTAIRAGKWEEAIAAATRAVEKDRGNVAANFNLGRAYLGAGKGMEAYGALMKASGANREPNADIEYYRGQAAEAAGLLMTAHGVYQNALARLPAPDKEIRLALEALTAKLIADAPTATQVAQVLEEQRTKGDVNTLSNAMNKLKQFLLGPEGAAATKVDGLTIYGGAPARVIITHSAGSVGQLNRGWSWVQWRDQGKVYLQGLEEESPVVIANAYFLDGSDGRYLLLDKSLGMHPWTEYLSVLKLDPTRPAWVKTEALSGLPPKVGTVEYKQGPGGISVDDPAIAKVALIHVLDEGRTLKLCDANEVCVTAQWNGTRYSLK
jgi:hypothetical protein